MQKKTFWLKAGELTISFVKNVNTGLSWLSFYANEENIVNFQYFIGPVSLFQD